MTTSSRPFLIGALAATAVPAMALEPDPIAGRGVYETLCASCHGDEARGDGPLAALLTVMPADLTQLTAQNDGVFPVIQVIRQIDGRDPMLAHGGVMPIFGQMFDFPDAAIASEAGQPIITAQPIADVTAWLETVQE